MSIVAMIYSPCVASIISIPRALFFSRLTDARVTNLSKSTALECGCKKYHTFALIDNVQRAIGRRKGKAQARPAAEPAELMTSSSCCESHCMGSNCSARI